MAVRTRYYENIIADGVSKDLYKYLRNNIPWVESVRSKLGFTRLGYSLSSQSKHYEKVEPVIITAMDICDIPYERLMYVYMNYYVDGTHWSPNHSHKDTIQIVISLGATRDLNVAKKVYPMNNGDVIVFGASIHGVPKDDTCKRGRISIALFISKK